MAAFLKALAVIGIAYSLAGIYYGSAIGVRILSKKYGLKGCEPAARLLVTALFTYIISCAVGGKQYIFRSLDDLSIYIAAILTVLITAVIVLLTPRDHKTPAELCGSALDGAIMELAQRLMMQPFVYWLLCSFLVPSADQLAILITATVWCLGILTQQLLCKMRLNRTFVIEILASFVFSMGVGYIFQKSRFILLTMLAHALERILSSLLNNRKYYAKK